MGTGGMSGWDARMGWNSGSHNDRCIEVKRKEVANSFVKSSVTQDEGDGEEV